MRSRSDVFLLKGRKEEEASNMLPGVRHSSSGESFKTSSFFCEGEMVNRTALDESVVPNCDGVSSPKVDGPQLPNARPKQSGSLLFTTPVSSASISESALPNAFSTLNQGGYDLPNRSGKTLTSPPSRVKITKEYVRKAPSLSGSTRCKRHHVAPNQDAEDQPVRSDQKQVPTSRCDRGKTPYVSEAQVGVVPVVNEESSPSLEWGEEARTGRLASLIGELGKGCYSPFKTGARSSVVSLYFDCNQTVQHAKEFSNFTGGDLNDKSMTAPFFSEFKQGSVLSGVMKDRPLDMTSSDHSQVYASMITASGLPSVSQLEATHEEQGHAGRAEVQITGTETHTSDEGENRTPQDVVPPEQSGPSAFILRFLKGFTTSLLGNVGFNQPQEGVDTDSQILDVDHTNQETEHRSSTDSCKDSIRQNSSVNHHQPKGSEMCPISGEFLNRTFNEDDEPPDFSGLNSADLSVMDLLATIHKEQELGVLNRKGSTIADNVNNADNRTRHLYEEAQQNDVSAVAEQRSTESAVEFTTLHSKRRYPLETIEEENVTEPGGELHASTKVEASKAIKTDAAINSFVSGGAFSEQSRRKATSKPAKPSPKHEADSQISSMANSLRASPCDDIAAVASEFHPSYEKGEASITNAPVVPGPPVTEKTEVAPSSPKSTGSSSNNRQEARSAAAANSGSSHTEVVVTYRAVAALSVALVFLVVLVLLTFVATRVVPTPLPFKDDRDLVVITVPLDDMLRNRSDSRESSTKEDEGETEMEVLVLDVEDE